jgi:uncharacterized protein YdhG (YjbR/CyaY superfamily)
MSARSSSATAKSVDQYISGFPPKVRKILQEVRAAVRAAAPGAVEKISYGMPAFWQGRILVYFAAHTAHLGFYPGAEAIVAFADRLEGYTTSRGTVQFPFDRPVPLALVKKIVAFRVRALPPARTSRGTPARPRAARPGSG